MVKRGDTVRYQIDHILMKCRYSNSVCNVKVYRGADINSNDNLVVAKVRLKLKKVLKAKSKTVLKSEED